MGGGGGGKYRPDTGAAAAPKESDPAIQEALAEQARRKARTRGYRSTVLASRMMSDETRASLQPQSPAKDTFGG